MALSREEKRQKNAEKQRKYRKTHLKEECDKIRLQCNLSTSAKMNLDRLAAHNGYTVTQMLEKLVDEETRNVLISLSAQDQIKFYDFELQRNQDAGDAINGTTE